MDYINYLETKQPIIYKILSNALSENKLFHAYLLSGEIGTPLLEMANFLAKSILCDEPTPFACLRCNTCERIENKNYSDLIVINGQRDSIKKDDIIRIENEFSRTSQNKKGLKVYIIHLIENMNPDSTNALLKFLEEPSENTYAIFTTENEYRILPTIISRVQILRFNSIDKSTLINDAVELGLSDDDAQLLSNFYNDPLSMIDHNDEDFQNYKRIVLDFLANLDDKRKIRFNITNKVIPISSSAQGCRFFIDMMLFFIKEAFLYSISQITIYTKYVNIFNVICNNVKNLDNVFLKLMEARNELNSNITASLIIYNVLISAFEV